MSDPAVILHRGQKLAVDSDTTEIFQALKAGKLEELDSVKETPTDDAGKEVQDDKEPAARKKSSGKKTTAKNPGEQVQEPFL